MNFILFNTDGFMPHGHCYSWTKEILWSNVISDSIITFSYYLIPCIIIYFLSKKKAFPFRFVLVMFGSFILLCGTTHLISIITIWKPIYRFESLVKILTAGISLITALSLIYIIPKALEFKSPEEFDETTKKLLEANARIKAMTDNESYTSTTQQYQNEDKKITDLPLLKSLVQTTFIPFIFFIISLIIFIKLVSELVFINQLIDHTDIEISKVYEIEKLTLDMETGIRAFLLTSKEVFLEPYKTSNEIINKNLIELNELITFDSSNVQAKNNLVELAQRNLFRLNEVKDRLSDFQSNSLWLLKLKNNSTGPLVNSLIEQKRIMDNIRAQLDLIIKSKQTYRSAILQETDSVVKKTLWITFTLSLIILFLLALYFWKRITTIARKYETALNQARNAETRFKDAVEAAPNGMLMINQASQIIMVNQQLENLFGYTRDELVGQLVEKLIPNEVKKHHPSFIASYFKKPEPRAMGAGRELFGLRKDGTKISVEIGLRPIYRNNEMFVISSVVDITARQNTQKLLKEKHEELEQFAYRTSHDLRSPLLSISGLSDCAAEDINEKDYDEAKKNLGKIKSLTIKLKTLVEDLLSLTKAESDNETLSEFNFEETVKVCKEKFNQDLIKNKFEIRQAFKNQRPLLTQKIRFTQVMDNFISNSIKYQDPKKQEHYVLITTRNDERKFYVDIEDNGLGIPANRQSEVFGMFKRFHPGSLVGSGLGLYIIKKHLSKLNSTVTFESSPNGTTFHLTIPLA